MCGSPRIGEVLEGESTWYQELWSLITSYCINGSDPGDPVARATAQSKASPPSPWGSSGPSPGEL